MPDGFSIGDSVVEVRLPPEDIAGLGVRSADLGMTPTEWIQSLVRAHVHREVPWRQEDLGEMATAAAGIKQIGALLKSDPNHGLEPTFVDQVMEAFLERVSAAAERHKSYWGIAASEV